MKQDQNLENLETRLIRNHGMGKRRAGPDRLSAVLALGLLASLACPLAVTAQDPVQAFTGLSEASSGLVLGNRAYLPGLVLTRDLVIYVGPHPTHETWYDMCTQVKHGVVCTGVKP